MKQAWISRIPKFECVGGTVSYVVIPWWLLVLAVTEYSPIVTAFGSCSAHNIPKVVSAFSSARAESWPTPAEGLEPVHTQLWSQLQIHPFMLLEGTCLLSPVLPGRHLS